MDSNDPATLLNLAIQSLLSSETAAIHALKEVPRGLFVPLFNAALMGGHKNIIMAMVKIWPFPCLHIGTLSIKGTQNEFLKAFVESLQILPAQNTDSWSPKLRILDLRQTTVCRTICPVNHPMSPICFHSCAYSEISALNVEAQCTIATTESEVQPSKQSMQLIVDLSLDGTLTENDFLSLLLSKVEQSSGSLHLCCRSLKINKLCDCKSTLSSLSFKCVDHLAVDQASLTEVTKILIHIVQLHRLNLSKIACTSLNGKVFKTFTTHLRRMDHLKELSLSSFCLTDHLENLLRGLPALDFLCLPFCGLSNKDFRFLSQCPQANHLKLLNLSNNRMYLEDCELFRGLLLKLSGALRHLEIDHCLLTDSTLSILIPALSQCSKLGMLSFASNPITMHMLMRILQSLTHLMELKSVIYPIPIHCYGRWHFRNTLDLQKLGSVQTELKMMLEVAQRNDMKWITYS